MSRYRRIETGTWTDQKYVELSSPPPNGRTLWHYLLTGQRTTIFPGLVDAKEVVIAADLGWPVTLEDAAADGDDGGCWCLRDAWAEIETRGMAVADWTTGVIVLPRALRDRRGNPRDTARPTSPNAFRGWHKSWDMIPDCEMKAWYLAELGRFADALDREARGNRKVYSETFADAFATPLERVSNAYPEAFSAQQPTGRAANQRVGNASATRRQRVGDPRAILSPVPDPVLLPECTRSGTGIRGSDLKADPSAHGGGDQPRGVVVPLTTATVAALGLRGTPPAVDPALALRRRLVDGFAARMNRERKALEEAGRIPEGARPLALMGQGERDLMDRLKESQDPEADLEHVISVVVAEADATGEGRWLSWSLAHPKTWQLKLATPLAEARARRSSASAFSAIDRAVADLERDRGGSDAP